MSSVFKAVPRFAQALKATSRPIPRCRPSIAPPVAITGYRSFSASSPVMISRFSSLGLDATPAVKSPEPSMRNAGFGSGRRLSEFSLENHVILISGGVGGVGIQQCEALMEAGATVYALDRVSTEGLPKDYYRLKERGEKELGVLLDYRKVDVRNPGELGEIVEAIANKHGRLDGMLAAAGINRVISSFEHQVSDFDEVLGINVTGAFLCAQAAAKQMVKFGKGGSIVMIGSMSGTIANKGLYCCAYNASKAAVIQLARNLAAEWGAYGIRVNTISPGYIVTPMVTVLFEEDPTRAQNWPSQNMLGRLSKPQEYRGAAVFLLSEASSFMTGSDLIIDGGHHSW